MMIMINQKKVYLGAIRTENIAARYYDYIAILSQGLNAKTNFAYTCYDIDRILKIFGVQHGRRPHTDKVKREKFLTEKNNSSPTTSGHSNNLKEDLLLANQLYEKQIPPNSMLATQGRGGSSSSVKPN